MTDEQICRTLRALNDEWNPHGPLLVSAAEIIESHAAHIMRLEATMNGLEFILGQVARWLAEGLGYPFDVSTDMPLPIRFREYLEEAWIVVNGDHRPEVEDAVSRNVAAAGGWL